MKRFLFVPLAALALSAQSLVPSATLPPETVVAAVDGKDVTIADVIKILNAAPPTFLQQLQVNPQAALTTYFTILHLSTEGEKQKLAEQSPLKEQLELVRAQAVAQQMVNNERDRFPVSSDDIDAYFAKNRATYEQAHIRVIQIAFKPPVPGAPKGTTTEDLTAALKQQMEAAKPGGGRTEAEALALATDVVKQLRGGADFTKLVAQYSDDETSKIAGGDFGSMKRDSAYPEDLRKAVFAMSAGETSDPVKVSSGFYVIRLVEKTVPPVQEVQGTIIQTIRQEHLQQYMLEVNSRFRPVVKNPDFFTRPAQSLGIK